MSRKVVEIAAAQVGVSEYPKGSNKGPEVDQYLLAVGINFAAAWCAAFVVWCHNRAGIEIPALVVCWICGTSQRQTALASLSRVT